MNYDSILDQRSSKINKKNLCANKSAHKTNIKTVNAGKDGSLYDSDWDKLDLVVNNKLNTLRFFRG